MSMAAAPSRYRPHIRPGHPGDRPHDQPHPPQMPPVQDAIPSLAGRAWKGRPTPLLLTSLRFARESGGCSKGWVYERRKSLLAKYKIDIEIPFAFYRDLAFFGPNSLTKPKVRAALNAALARGDAATNLHLRQKAAKDFDRRRIGVVGGTVRSPALLMAPKVVIDGAVAERDGPEVQSAPLVNRPRTMEVELPHSAPPELDEFDDLPADFEHVDLDEAAPIRPVAAGPKAQASKKKVRRWTRPSPPPPPTRKKVRLRGFYTPTPPPLQKKLTLSVRRSPRAPN